MSTAREADTSDGGKGAKPSQNYVDIDAAISRVFRVMNEVQILQTLKAIQSNLSGRNSGVKQIP